MLGPYAKIWGILPNITRVRLRSKTLVRYASIYLDVSCLDVRNPSIQHRQYVDVQGKKA